MVGSSLVALCVDEVKTGFKRIQFYENTLFDWKTLLTTVITIVKDVTRLLPIASLRELIGP